jgi:predicted GNAT family acetyltransferase
MTSVQFFKHTNPPLVQQFLRNHFPASIPIYHRIGSPQNIAERQILLLANFPPAYSSDPAELGTKGPVTVSFIDRSRHNESQIAIFNTLCQRYTKLTDLSNEYREILADQLQELLRTVYHIGTSYSTAEVKPLNYPFSPTVRFTASHEVIADILVQCLAVKPDYRYEYHELIFSTSQVKDMLASLKLPRGYELGKVAADQIDLVTSTSKVKRQPATLLENHNAAILYTDPDNTARKELVAWAYLSIDQSLTTLYVLPNHRGKGLAKVVAGAVIRDLCDGLVGGEKKIQSDWCFAQVAADNVESQGVCRSLGATFHKRTVTLGFDLDAWAASI